MSGLRYAYVRRPWRAFVGIDSPHPAAYYATLVNQTLRHGPRAAARRPRHFWSFLGRHGIPESAMAGAVTRLPTCTQPGLDRLLFDVARRWEELRTKSSRLPPSPEGVSALAVTRRAGQIAFIFGELPEPLLVAKVSGRLKSYGFEREDAALRAAEKACVSPRSLGSVGSAHLQEALPGEPLRIEPLAPVAAMNLKWTPAFGEMFEGLARLASETAKRQASEKLRIRLQLAIDRSNLEPGERRRLKAAADDIQRVEATVLGHGDTSPQNCILDGGRFAGFIDWETAIFDAPPGFDAWNLATAYIHHGAALARPSEEHSLETFELAWTDSPFAQTARAEARRTAIAGGASERHLDAMEICYFGWRLGRSLQVRVPGRRRVAPETRMLQAVLAA